MSANDYPSSSPYNMYKYDFDKFVKELKKNCEYMPTVGDWRTFGLEWPIRLAQQICNGNRENPYIHIVEEILPYLTKEQEIIEEIRIIDSMSSEYRNIAADIQYDLGRYMHICMEISRTDKVESEAAYNRYHGEIEYRINQNLPLHTAVEERFAKFNEKQKEHEENFQKIRSFCDSHLSSTVRA